MLLSEHMFIVLINTDISQKPVSKFHHVTFVGGPEGSVRVEDEVGGCYRRRYCCHSRTGSTGGS